MGPQGIIIWLVIGAIAGWLAGQIVKGGGFGLVGDIIVGIIGSTNGAVILLFILKLVRRT